MKQLVLFFVGLSCYGQVAFDMFDLYGGAKGLPCPTGATNHFYTEKISNRWWFCTPAGNAWWMVSSWNLDGAQVPNLPKYASPTSSNPANRHMVLARRVKNYGWNAADFYSAPYATPSYNSANLTYGSSMVTILGDTLRPTFYGSKNDEEYIDFPLKMVDRSIDWPTAGSAQHSANWHIYDFFDSNFKAYLKAQLLADGSFSHAFKALADPNWANTKWIAGIAVDETDNLHGFGAGHDFMTSVNGLTPTNDWKSHIHASLLILASPPTLGAENRNPAEDTSVSGMLLGNPRTQTVDCKDPLDSTAAGNPSTQPADTNCTKRALRLFLEDRYSTIGALNTAWGSSYTTFGTSATAQSNILVGTTNGTATFTGTIPVTGPSKITPESVRVYVGGTLVAADINARDMRSSGVVSGSGASTGFFACDGTTTTGYFWGEALSADITYGAAVCNSPINYATGAMTLVLDSAPANGTEVRVDYTINGWRAGGTGLMDETLYDSHAWAPKLDAAYDKTAPGLNDFHLDCGTTPTVSSGDGCSAANPYTTAFKTDMDDFLYYYAWRYFKDVRDAIDEVTPGCDRSIKGTCYLYVGPDYLGTWGSPPNRKILQAASEFVDVFPYYALPDDYLDDYQERLDWIGTHFGDKPIISWESFAARGIGSDSPFPRTRGNAPKANLASQAERGARYKEVMQYYLDATYTEHGSHPVIGMRWWDVAPLGSQVAEGYNWSIFTPVDDPIDGHCPGPGTRFEKVPGGPPVTNIITGADGTTATITVPFVSHVSSPSTAVYHGIGIGSRVRIVGATASTDVDLNGEYIYQYHGPHQGPVGCCVGYHVRGGGAGD
jgi:hypothetical protein